MPDLLAAGLPEPASGVFTTRAAGVSSAPYDGLNLGLHTGDVADGVLANRALLGRALGLGPGALVFGQQVHGVGVREVSAVSAPLAESPTGRDGDLPNTDLPNTDLPNTDLPNTDLPNTDALWTRAPGLALVMMGADCPPVLLAGDGVVGVAHVGRAGLAGGVLPALVAAMGGARSARIGPGICGRCYALPADLVARVEAAAPGSRCATRDGAPAVDLAAGAAAQLRAVGVTDVEQVGGCTVEQPERFFSYRRDGRTGRHGGVVWLS